jgi:hypothetical protein
MVLSPDGRQNYYQDIIASLLSKKASKLYIIFPINFSAGFDKEWFSDTIR